MTWRYIRRFPNRPRTYTFVVNNDRFCHERHWEILNSTGVKYQYRGANTSVTRNSLGWRLSKIIEKSKEQRSATICRFWQRHHLAKHKLTRNTWTDVFGTSDRKLVLSINEFDNAWDNLQTEILASRKWLSSFAQSISEKCCQRPVIINCCHSNILFRRPLQMSSFDALTPLALLNPLESLTSPNFVTNTRHFLLVLSGAHHESYYGHEPRGNPTFSSSTSLYTLVPFVFTFIQQHTSLEIVARRRCTDPPLEVEIYPRRLANNTQLHSKFAIASCPLGSLRLLRTILILYKFIINVLFSRCISHTHTL